MSFAALMEPSLALSKETNEVLAGCSTCVITISEVPEVAGTSLPREDPSNPSNVPDSDAMDANYGFNVNLPFWTKLKKKDIDSATMKIWETAFRKAAARVTSSESEYRSRADYLTHMVDGVVEVHFIL